MVVKKTKKTKKSKKKVANKKIGKKRKVTKKKAKKTKKKTKKKKGSNLYEAKSKKKKKKGEVVRTTTHGTVFTSNRIVELIERRKVPVFVKHCVLRVSEKLGGGNNAETFQKAFVVCIDCFQHYNFMYKNSTYKITFRGIQRARRHYKEGTVNVQKNKQFYIFYNKAMSKYIDTYKKAKGKR